MLVDIEQDIRDVPVRSDWSGQRFLYLVKKI